MLLNKASLGIILILFSYCYGQTCSVPGFNFDKISSSTNWQATWTTQTLSFAPCTTGTSAGCGSSGQPLNQCTGVASCCAVCQSWSEDTGPAGACLGLGSKFISASAMSSSSVKITYGGGDVVTPGNTPRQVDIVINCEQGGSTLGFSSFTPAEVTTPPPPYYLYTLTLTSNALCGGISGGSVFLIILFSAAVLYLIAGVIVNKFHFQKEGIEIVPNIDFWKEVPGWIVDGVMLTKTKIMSAVSSQSL